MEQSQSFNRILLFGAGAVGGYFGGLLAKAGLDVTFVARGERLEAMRKQGLILKSSEGKSTHIQVQAAASPAGLYDLIIISVKSAGTLKAAEVCRNHLEPTGAVLSLQNGVENLPILAEVFGADRVVGAVVNSGISVPVPGTILYRPTPKVTVGGMTEKSKAFEKPLVSMFQSTGVNAGSTEDITKALWGKLVWNIAFNPLSAITRATCGELIESEYAYRLMSRIGDEAVKAAAAEGVDLEADTVEKALALKPQYKDYKTSALQDVEVNKEPETDGIMGVVVEKSRLGLIDAPVTEAVYDIAKFMYGRWFQISPRLAADVIVYNGYGVLLIERKYEPYGWAIPGGMTDLGETLEQTACREIQEETGIILTPEEIKLLGVYSDPSRDPRGHTVSAVYYAYSEMEAVAADDAANAGFFLPEELPPLAFDHAKVLADFFRLDHIRYP